MDTPAHTSTIPARWLTRLSVVGTRPATVSVTPERVVVTDDADGSVLFDESRYDLAVHAEPATGWTLLETHAHRAGVMFTDPRAVYAAAAALVVAFLLGEYLFGRYAVVLFAVFLLYRPWLRRREQASAGRRALADALGLSPAYGPIETPRT